MEALLFINDKEKGTEAAASLALNFNAARGDPKKVKEQIRDLQK